MIKNKYIYDNTSIFFGLIASIILIAVFMLIENAFVKTVFTFLYVIILLVLNQQVGWLMMMFIIPANEFLHISNGTSLMLIFIIFFTGKMLLIKPFGFYKIKIATFISSILLLCYSVFVFLKFGTIGQLETTIKGFLFVYYGCNAICSVNSDCEKEQLFYYSFLFISLGISIIGIISILVYGFPVGMGRWSFTSDTTINTQGIICAISVINLIFCTYILGVETHIKNIVLLSITLNVVFGLLTQSRSFILVLFIGVFLIGLFVGNPKTGMNFILAIILLFVVLLVCYNISSTFSTLADRVLLRFLGVDDISNGRYSLWGETVQKMHLNPLFAWFGAGDYLSFAVWNERHNAIKSAHNMFLEVWVIYGYLGALLVLSFFISVIKEYVIGHRNNRIKINMFIPVITMLSALLFSHHFIGRGMSLVFILSILPFAMDIQNKNVRVNSNESIVLNKESR